MGGTRGGGREVLLTVGTYRVKMCEEEDEEEEEEANCHYRQLGWLLLQNDLQKCCINWAGLFITATCVCARLAVSDRPNEVLTAVTVFFVLLLCVM